MKSIHQISRDRAGFSGTGNFYPHACTFDAAPEDGGSNIDVTVQITDIEGRPLKTKHILFGAYIGVDTAGVYTGAANMVSSPSVGSGTALRLTLMATNFGGLFISDVDGKAVIRLSVSGVATRRLVITVGGAVIGQSSTLTWA